MTSAFVTYSCKTLTERSGNMPVQTPVRTATHYQTYLQTLIGLYSVVKCCRFESAKFFLAHEILATTFQNSYFQKY